MAMRCAESKPPKTRIVVSKTDTFASKLKSGRSVLMMFTARRNSEWLPERKIDSQRTNKNE